MPAKRSIFRFVIVTLIVMLAVFAAGVCRAWHEYKAEAELQNMFFPLAKALGNYEADYRSPAGNLAKLVPLYIPQLPSSRFADSVEYAVIDGGKAWQLAIHSRTPSPLSQRRIYLYRSTQKLTPDEERRVLVRSPHGMLTILRE